MVLDDIATLVTDGTPRGDVACFVGHEKSDLLSSDAAQAIVPIHLTTFLVELPLSDAETGEPLGIEPEEITGFQWRGHWWQSDTSPSIRRQHGEDHHASWNMRKAGRV